MTGTQRQHTMTRRQTPVVRSLTYDDGQRDGFDHGFLWGSIATLAAVGLFGVIAYGYAYATGLIR